jgi:hypothetical protein
LALKNVKSWHNEFLGGSKNIVFFFWQTNDFSVGSVGISWARYFFDFLLKGDNSQWTFHGFDQLGQLVSWATFFTPPTQ